MKSNIKIFDINYLMDAELTDEDLYNLFYKSSLKYSIIISEFKEAKINMPDTDIIKICETNNNWMYNYFWNANQLKSFTKKLIKVYKNVYNYGDERCKAEAEWFITMYGLTNIKCKNHIYTLCE